LLYDSHHAYDVRINGLIFEGFFRATIRTLKWSSTHFTFCGLRDLSGYYITIVFLPIDFFSRLQMWCYSYVLRVQLAYTIYRIKNNNNKCFLLNFYKRNFDICIFGIKITCQSVFVYYLNTWLKIIWFDYLVANLGSNLKK